MRIGRHVVYEREFDHGKRVVSFGFDPSLAARQNLGEALHVLAQAQEFAERDAGFRPCSLELVATVSHGWPIALSYTLHFEVTPV